MLNKKTNRSAKSKLIVTFTLALLCAACASNEGGQGGKGGERGSKKGPPAEAFAACKTLSVGDACTVSTPRGEMTGSCTAAPSGQEGPLACAPKGGMGGGRPQMSR